MTSVNGSNYIATPCCRTLYKTPRYSSMNRSAWFYWTDGYEDRVLTAADGGLRKCQCGNFYLLPATIKLPLAVSEEIPYAVGLSEQDLPDAIQSENRSVQLVARREYWRYLNRPYRETYSALRETEEKIATAKSKAENLDERSKVKKFLDKLAFKKMPAPPPPVRLPFTTPAFDPSALQIENMSKLLDLLLQVQRETNSPSTSETAELYRELGQLDEARAAIKTCRNSGVGLAERLIAELIDECRTCPVRYRA